MRGEDGRTGRGRVVPKPYRHVNAGCEHGGSDLLLAVGGDGAQQTAAVLIRPHQHQTVRLVHSRQLCTTECGAVQHSPTVR
jgi:hypothetical protein